jgi:hypothetical protein
LPLLSVRLVPRDSLAGHEAVSIGYRDDTFTHAVRTVRRRRKNQRTLLDEFFVMRVDVMT